MSISASNNPYPEDSYAPLTLQEVTSAGATTDKSITVNVEGETTAINGISINGIGIVGISSNYNGVYGYSNQGAGVFGKSENNSAGVFDIPLSNNSNVVDFRRAGVSQGNVDKEGNLIIKRIIVNKTDYNELDKLQVNGSALCTQYKISALNTAPATATSTGTLGEIRVTGTHIYVCIATNTWVRTALTTW